MMRKLPALMLIVIALFGCRETTSTPEPTGNSLSDNFALDTLTIETPNGASHDFNVYLALTPAQQRRGLMFVRELPANSGMLFVYDVSGHRSMWMKNTFIPLDLVFAKDDGTISSIIHNAEPLTLTSRGSTEPVSWVLELNGGTARRLGIGPGSRIIWNAATGDE